VFWGFKKKKKKKKSPPLPSTFPVAFEAEAMGGYYEYGEEKQQEKAGYS